MMKHASILAGMLLAATALSASAAELTLFGQPLPTVDRATLTAAATSAGAKLSKSTEAGDTFDASGVGIPGAQSLEVVYLNGRVVLAQYKLEKHSSTDESFRKMLVAKYGYPSSVDRTLNPSTPKEFDQQYISDGKYRWKFDRGMDLVFSKEFFGDRYLTYVNKPMEAQMQRLLDAAEKKRAGEAAKAKSDVF
jgi:hypothetical protein